jgi:four helix bundle protein
MKPSELKERTKVFAHNCVKIAVSIPDNSLGKHIKNQLIRCSTSVAANYRATCLSQSRKSFIAKISIVIEEADETCFWLEFIINENLLTYEIISPILKEANELTSIFIASRKTAENNNQSTINN